MLQRTLLASAVVIALFSASCAHLFGGSLLVGYELRLFNWESPVVYFQPHTQENWVKLPPGISVGGILIIRDVATPIEMPGRIRIVDRGETFTLIAFRGEDNWGDHFRSTSNNVSVKRTAKKIDLTSFVNGEPLEEESWGGIPIHILELAWIQE